MPKRFGPKRYSGFRRTGRRSSRLFKSSRSRVIPYSNTIPRNRFIYLPPIYRIKLKSALSYQDNFVPRQGEGNQSSFFSNVVYDPSSFRAYRALQSPVAIAPLQVQYAPVNPSHWAALSRIYTNFRVCSVRVKITINSSDSVPALYTFCDVPNGFQSLPALNAVSTPGEFEQEEAQLRTLPRASMKTVGSSGGNAQQVFYGLYDLMKQDGFDMTKIGMTKASLNNSTIIGGVGSRIPRNLPDPLGQDNVFNEVIQNNFPAIVLFGNGGLLSLHPDETITTNCTWEIETDVEFSGIGVSQGGNLVQNWQNMTLRPA